MMITIYLKANDISIDVGVNPKQKIHETFKILRSKGIGVEKDIEYVFLDRTQSNLNILLDYKTAKIFNGDKLIL